MTKTIHRYVFREVAVPFLLSLFILTATALLSKVIKLIELMVTHGLGVSFVFWFVVSVMPSFLIYTIPISFLIGVLVAFTRLSSDSEITAMKATGLSLFSIMPPVALLSALTFLATLVFTLYAFPWGNVNMKGLLYDAARTRFTSGIEEKTFYDSFKGAILYVDRVSPDTGEMEGVFISEGAGEKEPNLFFAKSGSFKPSDDKSTVYLSLRDGVIHRKDRDDATYHIADFGSYTLELTLADVGVANPADRANRDLYIGEMMARVKEARARKEDTAPYLIDLHKRFALPVSVFVFAIMGVPLGIQKVRSARFTGFSVSLGVVLIYYVLSTAFEALGNNRHIDPVLAVYGSDIIFLMAGVYIFYRTAKDEPLSPASLFKRGPSAP